MFEVSFKLSISSNEPVAKGVSWYEYYMMVKSAGWLSRMPHYIEICLVILLAWSILSWWMGQPRESHSVDSFAIEMHKDTPALLDESKLMHIALFGEVLEKKVTKKKVYTPVAVSALRLKLLATIVAGKRSAAVVRFEGSSKQQVFILGDAIQEGVILKEVERLAIVVSHQGRLERVVLRQEMAQANLAIVSNNFMPRKHLKLKQESLNRKYIQKQAKSLSKLFQQAQVLPYMKNGKLEGFVVSNILSDSSYKMDGLQNGDIVRKVNGQPVTGTQQAMVMYKGLKDASSIDLELLRHGTIIFIHHEIK